MSPSSCKELSPGSCPLFVWAPDSGPPGHFPRGMWDRDTVCCVLEQSWAGHKNKWGMNSRLTELRAQEKTRNLQGDCLTRLTEECLWSGPFLGGLMLCFRGESMCLTARDHTSWLIPASSIFLSPMSTTTHPNRPLTKCLLVMTTSNTNISSATAEVCVNNSDSICLWSLTTKHTLFFSMQNLWKTPSHVWNELLCQLETLRISLGLRSGSLTNWCISWLHRPAEGLWSELNWPVFQKTGIKHSRAHEGNVACPGHKAVCLVAEAGVKSRFLDINSGFLSLCALSDCPDPSSKKRKTELMLIEDWEGQRKQQRHKAIVPLF